MIVIILKGTVIEQPLMDEIYGMINKEAEGRGIQEVPVAFTLGGIPELHQTRED